MSASILRPEARFTGEAGKSVEWCHECTSLSISPTTRQASQTEPRVAARDHRSRVVLS